jgi:hypothetical protein
VHVENGRDVDRGLAFVQGTLYASCALRISCCVVHKAHPGGPVGQVSPPDPPKDLGPPTPGPSQSSDQTRVHHNPFTQLDEPPKTQSAHNPFVNRVKAQSHLDDQPKLPPLPPRKPPPLPPALLPPPRHNSTKSGNITSTLMKQSLQASKAAQTMKRAESQLEQERVLQVLKSSSVVSGGYSLAGAHITRSSIVVGASIQNRTGSNPNPTASYSAHASINPNRSPSPAARIAYGHGRGYGSSSVGSASSASASEAPPLPRRRQNQARSHQHQQQPSPPVSVSSLEQVALASSSPTRPPSLPQNSPANPYHRVSPMPAHTSTLTSSTAYNSPQGSPTRSSVDLQPGRPPTHPDRKPYFSHSHPTTLDAENPSQDITVPDHFPNGNGISPVPTTSASTSTTTSSYTTASGVSPFQTPEGSPTARVFRSKSLHYPPPPPPARRRRPESAQMLAREDVFGGAEHTGDVDVDEDGGGVDMDGQGQTLSRHSSLSMPAYTTTTTTTTTTALSGAHKRSSHSVSSPSSTHIARTAYSHPTTHSQYTLPSHHESPFSNIFASIQPKLDKARYKAEAGLSRRGFVAAPLPSSSLLIGGGGGSDEGGGGGGIGEGGRKGRRGRVGGASSVLSGEEREEREELVVHRNGSLGRGGGGGDEDESPSVDEVDGDDQSKRGMGVGGGRRRGTSSSRSARIGGVGSLNGVGGDTVLESDDTGGDGEGEVEAWRREVKQRWGGGVRDKDELKLPAGEGWRPL